MLRLQKYLAQCGMGSRRACEEYIRNGEVAVNGRTADSLGVKVDPQRDRVTCRGIPAVPAEKAYYKLNKPTGYVSSNYDPHHSLFARDLLRNVPEYRSLFHVGRLDKDSSGLMIFTNDGDFSLKLQHPRYQIEKEYFVRTPEKIPAEFLEMCTHGVQLNDGIVYTIKRYRLLSYNESLIVLTEGKKREIRHLFASFGCSIDTLHRTRIGPITLDSLGPGEYASLEPETVQSVLQN